MKFLLPLVLCLCGCASVPVSQTDRDAVQRVRIQWAVDTVQKGAPRLAELQWRRGTFRAINVSKCPVDFQIAWLRMLEGLDAVIAAQRKGGNLETNLDLQFANRAALHQLAVLRRLFKKYGR